MNTLEAHYKNIIRANDENRLTIFVGAGVSKSSNTPQFTSPSWEELIEELKVDLGLPKENDYLKIAQLYYLEFKEPTYYSKISSFFPEHVEPSIVHESIFELMPHCIITTNWDCILEKAIDNNGHLYDVVCSDKDLVKSTNLKKVIKMHGDFKNHNIVFKEDDYLNYTHDFPLIENNIKSILSTNTILFLGYSYNDINLKHIMKWIQNHSSFCPPMYLVTFNSNQAQLQYLENHGITTLVLPETNDDEMEFSSLDSYSQRLAIFLNNIKNRKSTSETSYSQNDAVSYVYEKIKHLENFEYLLLDQVKSSITNCGYEYTDCERAVLRFYTQDGIATTDLDLKSREVHSLFIEYVSQFNELNTKEQESFIQKNAHFRKVLQIFAKANIVGIMLSDKERTYLVNPFALCTEDQLVKDCLYLNFAENSAIPSNDELITKAYQCYENRDYEKAFEITLELISIAKKTKDYSLLLKSIFNRNHLLFFLKYSIGQIDTEKYKTLKPIELEGIYTQLPKSELSSFKFLYDFLTLNTMYKTSFYTSQKLLEVEKAVLNVKSGGMSFNNRANQPSVEHKDLLLFPKANGIMIEREAVYNATQKSFVKVAVLRKSIQKNIVLNIYELYTCIKYFKTDLLNELFNNLSVDEKTKTINVSDKDRKWLLETAFQNIHQQYLESSHWNSPEDQLKNVIYVISIIKLDKNETDYVIEKFSQLIKSNNISIDVYRIINTFFAHQYDLFDNSIDNTLLIKLIESIINKVVERRANGWDTHAIHSNSVSNLYGYVEVTNGIFTNEQLIDRLLLDLNQLDSKDKIRYSETLLFSIFKIANDLIKETIKSFVKSLIDELGDNSSHSSSFELWTYAVGFNEFNPDSLSRLSESISKYEVGKSFSSELYRFKNLTDYLIKEKGLSEFEEIDLELDNHIQAYENRQNLSTV